jgi:hypothetical protein
MPESADMTREYRHVWRAKAGRGTDWQAWDQAPEVRLTLHVYGKPEAVISPQTGKAPGLVRGTINPPVAREIAVEYLSGLRE